MMLRNRQWVYSIGRGIQSQILAFAAGTNISNRQAQNGAEYWFLW